MSLRPTAALAAALILMCSALSGCASSPAQSPDDRDLIERNRAYDAALVAGSGAGLDAIYAPDFEYIGAAGMIRTRDEQIRAFASGSVDLLEGRSDEVRIRRYGDTAVLTGRFQGRVRDGKGEYAFTERYSTVWVHGHDGWKLVLEHGTVIPLD
jgi:ketosteroid isomerase-like protein